MSERERVREKEREKEGAREGERERERERERREREGGREREREGRESFQHSWPYARPLFAHIESSRQSHFPGGNAGCTDLSQDYQDERAHIAIAEAAENLLHMGCDSTDDDDA